MPIYEYKAISKNGKVIANKRNIEGSEQVVRNKLLEKDLKPISIKKKAFDLESMIEKVRPKQKNQKAAIALNDNEIKEQDYRKNKVEEEKKKIEIKASKQILKTQINLNLDLSFLDQATYDDVVSFTQMFLLLKKANFTNMRAIIKIHNNKDNNKKKYI